MSRNARHHEVLTYKITREADQPISPNSSFIIQNSPFLSLSYLGLNPESIHLTDPFARPPAPHPTPRPPQLKRGVVNMLLSREYWRYLER